MNDVPREEWDRQAATACSAGQNPSMGKVETMMKTAIQQSEIDRESELAMKTMARTLEVTQQLIARLAPVSRQELKDQAGQVGRVEPGVGSSVGQKFRSLTDMAGKANAMLREATERLAI